MTKVELELDRRPEAYEEAIDAALDGAEYYLHNDDRQILEELRDAIRRQC